MSFLREPDVEPIPGYRLIEPIGRGGFGEVWKCEAPGGLFKAMKFVYGNLNSLDADGVRAEQELKALERVKAIRHPFVLMMENIQVVDGELVIVMELADKSLMDYYLECQSAGLVGIPRDALLRYTRDASEGLDHMIEKHGLQHLDIKPSNLFLISDRVKVADFGLVKHLERTGASGILGGVTPLYAPPETLNNKISPQSDQYSLAIVYMELLTGQRPFNGKNVRTLALQHMTEQPELRPLPEAERPVIARALSKDPAQRFPTCLAFVRTLYNARLTGRPETVLNTANNGAAGTASAEGNHVQTLSETMDNLMLGLPEPQSPASPSSTGVSPLPTKEQLEEVSGLGITIAHPHTGALRPTLIVGIGSFGRRALLELRCRFLDRFGDLSAVPMIRFLYLDPDVEAVKAAVRGAPDVALANQEVFHLPLQSIGNYRRRNIDQLADWLPREKLYGMPRSLQTQGCRALGRLAYTDNYQRFLARMRRELQQASHPDAIYQSVVQSGLALRDNVPRVYVVAPAGGGSSGLLVDMGYGLRRVLAQLNQNNADITVFLFCGATSDPATPKQEQANIYATLTELNHYQDRSVTFSAQYGPDMPRIVEQGQPYSCVYLMQVNHRSPETLCDAVAHLGSFVFHDLTTPLGLRLEKVRHDDMIAGATLMRTPFRSFGTCAIWFPRGLMLRQAARQACARLIAEWQITGQPTMMSEIESACARALADPELRMESLSARIEEVARTPAEGDPAEALTGLLASLEEQAHQYVAHEDPGRWARQALARVREWVGEGLSTDRESAWRKSRLGRALSRAIEQVAEEWSKRLSCVAFSLMEEPGRRLAAAEAALQRFVLYCHETSSTQRIKCQQHVQKTALAWQQIESALEACLGGSGGFSFFGSRTRRLLRVFMDHLAAFARLRLVEEVASAGWHCLESIRGRLEDRLRDLAFCRQRLRHLQESFEAPEALDYLPMSSDLPLSETPLPPAESFWDGIQRSRNVRVVLPDDETDLYRAAERFQKMLTADQWTMLDQLLQESVLVPLGGLHQACVSTGDLLRSLAGPMITKVAACLSDLLPVTDVAQVELSTAATGGSDLHRVAKECFDDAVPFVIGKEPAKQTAFLLVPASEAGKFYGEEAQRAVAGLNLVSVSGQADLMFCREQGFLSTEELHHLLAACRTAYDDTAPVPHISPHARFDVLDWIPLDP